MVVSDRGFACLRRPRLGVGPEEVVRQVCPLRTLFLVLVRVIRVVQVLDQPIRGVITEERVDSWGYDWYCVFGNVWFRGFVFLREGVRSREVGNEEEVTSVVRAVCVDAKYTDAGFEIVAAMSNCNRRVLCVYVCARIFRSPFLCRLTQRDVSRHGVLRAGVQAVFGVSITCPIVIIQVLC